jgi:hypothetical protein
MAARRSNIPEVGYGAIQVTQRAILDEALTFLILPRPEVVSAIDCS